MLLFLTLAGCDNPLDDLSQSWQVDRLRVLAVAAEPAEPRPGELVTFQSLTVAPAGQEASFVGWFACLPESADDYGCTVDPAVYETLAAVDPTKLSPEEQAALYKELVAAGLIGVEPYFSPSWTAPADALAGLEAGDRQEGVNALVSIVAAPAGEMVDEADLELAYKRVPISEADTPNHNPGCSSLTAAGAASGDGPVAVAAGEAVELTVSLAADAIETYLYTTEEGVTEERVEQPYVLWYTLSGEFDQTATLDPDYTVAWTAPATGGASTVWSVVRDRRGGMCWSSVDLSAG